jgi:hypothetical protein
VLVVLSGLLAAGCGGAGGAGEASCVGPILTVATATAAAGSSVRISGRFFVADCHDVVVRGESPQANQPLGLLDVMWTDSAKSTQRVATVRPDSHGSIATAVRIPSDSRLGEGQLSIQGYSQPVALQITG